MRPVVIAAVVSAFIVLGGVPRAEAGGGKKRATMKVCSTKKVGKQSRRTCKRVAIFQGHNADRRALRDAPLDRPSGDISINAPNFRQSLTVNIYRPDGALDEAVLGQLDDLFRCKRSGETRAVDPRLYEMLSRIYDHFGQRQVELVSGLRFTERDSSRHHHAAAMDIRISGVTIKEMYAYAESLDAGGMGIGIYPTSKFIHVDFRAPGDPSYRWTDLSGPNGGGGKSVKGKGKGKAAPVRKSAPRKPTS